MAQECDNGGAAPAPSPAPANVGRTFDAAIKPE